MTDLEISVVTKLLSSDAPGATEYLAQVPYAQVVATWGARSPSVDLSVRPGAVRASGAPDGIFAGGAVTDRRGDSVGRGRLAQRNRVRLVYGRAPTCTTRA
ncbi:hypothetical protein [Nocardia gamkensis]|uniref:hypothetical protein n=1 Tax=Nocardia gamkensis TaxID=352869 RepID=UPI001FDEDDA0|nr:hypothetical protein [Nocardia gamkensis]